MFRSLAFVTVWQHHHQSVGAKPLGYAARDEQVDHDLRADHEVAELRFPAHEGLGVGKRVAVLAPEHAVFAQRTVEHFALAMLALAERHVLALVILVDPVRVALTYRTAPRLLPRQPHAISL